MYEILIQIKCKSNTFIEIFIKSFAQNHCYFTDFHKIIMIKCLQYNC